MRVSRLLAFSWRLCKRALDVSLPMNPRIKATQSAMLAVVVPRSGVPKKTTPMVDLKRYSYFILSREALSNACSMAVVSRERIF